MDLAERMHPELVGQLTADELLASLLVANGLHPDDVNVRISSALDSVRPFLAGHGGDVELLDIDEAVGAVHLRLIGSCDGCPSSAVTLQHAVERAILEAAPEIVTIDVEHRPTPASRWSRSGASRRSPTTRPPAAVPSRGVRRERPAGRSCSGSAEMPRPKPRPGERCEMCAELIPDQHGHVVDLEHRSLMCPCRGCYLLFTSGGAGGNRFRAVPDRYLSFPEFRLQSASGTRCRSR